MLRARVDRPRCIGAGNCITIAPTAFDWHRGDFGKAGVVDAASVDEGIRSRWFRGPAGSALAALALDPTAPIVRAAQDASLGALDAGEADLLKLVVQGLSNEEIAERLEVDPSEVSRRLASMYATIGASSRADATAFAFQSRIL